MERERRQYYEWCRTDVLRRVGGEACRVLSVGCGAGVTEAALLVEGRKVCGVEMDPAAASMARSRGVEVVEARAEEAIPMLSGQSFDCLIFADVLEHLCEPERVLREYCGLLSTGGQVIISVPNFRNWQVLWQLFVRGGIVYTDAGILDRTHVRITTRRMAEEWMDSAGVDVLGSEYQFGRKYRIASVLSAGVFSGFLARQALVWGIKRGS